MSKPVPQTLPFDEAIEFFNRKGYAISANSWRDVWAAEHAHAFTVARVTAMDLLEDIRGAVERALKEGLPLDEFKSGLSETLAGKGWTGIPPHRLDTIYRTNLQSAYQAGRYKQMFEASVIHPFWMYDAVGDGRTRPEHAALSDKVYRFDHPFWQTWYPPNGFNCRCSVRALTMRRMDRKGLKEETEMPSFGPDEGFDYNPGLTAWGPELGRYSPEALDLLALEDILRPKDFGPLEKKLMSIREGFGSAGVPTADVPIRLKSIPENTAHGYADLITGIVGIRDSEYWEIFRVLKSGSAMSGPRVEALSTLVHELGHHLGKKIDINRYSSDLGYKVLVESVNELWARDRLPEIIRALGLRTDPGIVAQAQTFQLIACQNWVQPIQRIFRALHLTPAEVREFIDDLKYSESPENFSDRFWKLIVDRKPTIVPTGDFGAIIGDPFKWMPFEALIETAG